MQKFLGTLDKFLVFFVFQMQKMQILSSKYHYIFNNFVSFFDQDLF